MSRNPVLYKILVVGVIVLFIGIGIQPAFAVDTKTTISNNQNEDCKSCDEVSESDLIKIDKLLNKVDVYSKLLLMLSKYNSELREMSEELSNQLSNINKLYDEFNINILQQSTRPICFILEPLYAIIWFIWTVSSAICYYAIWCYSLEMVLLLILFLPILIVVTPIFMVVEEMIVKFDCDRWI